MYIWIPLHSYTDKQQDLEIEHYSIKFTPRTIVLHHNNTELDLYGIHPTLPKINLADYTSAIAKQMQDLVGLVDHYVVFGSHVKQLFDGVDVDLYKLAIRYNIVWGAFRIDDDSLDVNVRDTKYSLIADLAKSTTQILTAIVDSSNNPSKTTETKKAKNQNQKKEKKEGKETMANLFGDIRVGKAGSKYSLTYFGTVAFCGKTYYEGKIFDANGMTINFDMLYIIPSNEVKAGDIIEKNNTGYYVLDVNNGVVRAVNLGNGTEENLVPGGPFGMTMYAKVFNPMGNMKGDNSFGNMLMMQALMGDGGYDNSNNGMLLAMMMMQGGFKFPTFEVPSLPQASGEKPAEKK